MNNRILISEIFGPTIQGEGSLIGRPTVFVRTGGCDYRCEWCDTLYAVLPKYKSDWTPHTDVEVLEKVLSLTGGQPILITLSGGNPALQPLEALLDLGHERGCTFAMETQGSLAKAWFAKLDHLVLSPKPPSSGMSLHWERLTECIEAAKSTSDGVAASINLKIVLFDDADYAFAREVHRRFPQLPMTLQVGNPSPAQPQNSWGEASDAAAMSRERVEWLLQKVARDGWLDVTILPQLHVLLWGNKRGV
jgi:7-carboxy-7-deazaguanine synthase